MFALSLNQIALVMLTWTLLMCCLFLTAISAWVFVCVLFLRFICVLFFWVCLWNIWLACTMKFSSCNESIRVLSLNYYHNYVDYYVIPELCHLVSSNIDISVFLKGYYTRFVEWSEFIDLLLMFCSKCNKFLLISSIHYDLLEFVDVNLSSWNALSFPYTSCKV